MPTRERMRTLIAVLMLIGAATGAFAAIEFTADKTDYAVGEIVHLTATNNGPGSENFVSQPFFIIYNDDTDVCIDGCLGLPVVTPFPAGETVTMDWDTGSIPDVPGNYRVDLAMLEPHTVTYVLAGAVTVEPRGWTGLKVSYR